MDPTGIVLEAAKWGQQAVAAARTKAEKRSANVLERAAVLAAGMRHLDRRFEELFRPLTFYDPGSWPIERRREHAEAMLNFMYHERVIADMANALVWLNNAELDDKHADVVLRRMCDLVAGVVWRSHAGQQGPTGDDLQHLSLDAVPSGLTTWADEVRRATTGDLDSAAAPKVVALVKVLRSDEPNGELVQRLAATCLVAPQSKAAFAEIAFMGYSSHLDEVASIHYSGPSDVDLSDAAAPWRPIGTVSPLQAYSERVGARFQELLAVVQGSLPGVPTPTWMYTS